jgi:hypothetical protein
MTHFFASPRLFTSSLVTAVNCSNRDVQRSQLSTTFSSDDMDLHGTFRACAGDDKIFPITNHRILRHLSLVSMETSKAFCPECSVGSRAVPSHSQLCKSSEISTQPSSIRYHCEPFKLSNDQIGYKYFFTIRLQVCIPKSEISIRLCVVSYQEYQHFRVSKYLPAYHASIFYPDLRTEQG